MTSLAVLVRPTLLWQRASEATGLECLAIGFFLATLESAIWITGTVTQISEPYPNAYAYFIEEGSIVLVRSFSFVFALGGVILIPLVLINSYRPFLHRIKTTLLAHVPLLLPILVWSFAYMCDVTNEPSFQLHTGPTWLTWPIWRYLSSGYWLAVFVALWIVLTIRGILWTRTANAG